MERKPKVVRLIDLAEKIGLDLTEIHDEVSKRIYGAEVIEDEKEKGWIDIETADEDPKVVEDWYSLTTTQIHGRRVAPKDGWDWENQHGGCDGTVLDNELDYLGWVTVKWDTGQEYGYRHGADKIFDLIPIKEEK